MVFYKTSLIIPLTCVGKKIYCEDKYKLNNLTPMLCGSIILVKLIKFLREFPE